jgi:hypothetical protein
MSERCKGPADSGAYSLDLRSMNPRFEVPNPRQRCRCRGMQSLPAQPHGQGCVRERRSCINGAGSSVCRSNLGNGRGTGEKCAPIIRDHLYARCLLRPRLLCGQETHYSGLDRDATLQTVGSWKCQCPEGSNKAAHPPKEFDGQLNALVPAETS